MLTNYIEAMHSRVLLCVTVLPCVFARINFGHNSCKSLWLYPFAPIVKNCYANPDVGSNVGAIAPRHGYLTETHSVTTSDGYILTLFRIFAKSNGATETKSPVFIQHGIMSNANHFVSVNNRSLAFLLADLGHEVWIGNFRGTTYSKNHVTLTPNSYEFWEFSYEDIMIDVRDQLRYVADVIGDNSSLIYIGHSLGSPLVYIYALEYPEEAKNMIKGIINLAPAVYMDSSTFYKPLAPFAIPFLKLLKFVGINALFYPEWIVHTLVSILSRIVPIFGKWLTFAIVGVSDQFPTEDLLLIWRNYIPASASVNSFMQLFQISQAGQFQKFDYGKRKNLKIYNSEKPPVYNITNIDIPNYIFYGANDNLVAAKDCQKTFEKLGSAEKSISSVPRDKKSKSAFNHLDFVYGKDLNQYLYAELLIPLLQEKFS